MSERKVHDYDDVEPIVDEVKYKGKQYVLKEASTAAGKAYKNCLIGSMTFGPEGKATKIQGMANVEPLLVSMCLFEVTPNGEKPVPQTFVETFPNKMTKDLFERIKEISDLNEESVERGLLLKALARPDSPLKLETFREWVDNLKTDDGKDAEEYKPLRAFVKPTAEELAKNEQSGTMAGSA